MDIERISQRQIDPAVTGQGAARRAERAGNESQVKTDDPRSVRSSSDTLEISTRSRELARIRQAVDAAPDVRADKVAEIKKRIEDGTYSVSPQLLAQKLLEGLMRSAGPEIGVVTHRLADLEAVLLPLVPALEQLHHAQIEQRRLVAAGDLSAMVTINTTIQDISARIALLEDRRQAIQAELEAELGVQGLRAVLMTAAVAPPDRTRLGQLLVQVTRLVRDLREQGRQNAGLLDAAIGAAQRTRQVLQRLSGADNTYDPVKARRHQAAMRARASLTLAPRSPEALREGTPPAQAGRLPGQPGEDAASSAPAALGREAS